jgi:hypothetical protein
MKKDHPDADHASQVPRTQEIHTPALPIMVDTSESPSPAYSQSMSSELPIPVWPNGWYACDILHGFQAIDQSGTGLSLHTRFVQAFNTPIVKTTYYDARRRWDRRATPAQCHCPRCETDTSRFMVCFHSKPSPSTATLLSRPYYIPTATNLLMK